MILITFISVMAAVIAIIRTFESIITALTVNALLVYTNNSEFCENGSLTMVLITDTLEKAVRTARVSICCIRFHSRRNLGKGFEPNLVFL